MIIGCYSLDLYCDGAKDCKKRSATRYGGPPAQFIAEAGTECRRDARKAGWLLNLDEGTAVCPECKDMGFRPGKALMKPEIVCMPTRTVWLTMLIMMSPGC